MYSSSYAPNHYTFVFSKSPPIRFRNGLGAVGGRLLYASMKDQKRWIVWNAEEVGGRTTKVPYTVSGKRASSTDHNTWSTYAEAKKASEFFSGMGIIFTPDQTLLGIDIDHVLVDGKVSHEKAPHIKALIKEANTHTEISPSGDGLHLYLALTAPLALEANRHSPFEAYTSGRFFTFTENHFGKAKPIRTITPEEAIGLLTIIGYPWGKKELTALIEEASHTTSNFTDDELLDRMFSSRNGEKVRALYDGDLSEYDNDASRADSALLHHLAFWSGKDSSQMERIWRGSALGKRTKTSSRADYRLRSIQNAIQSCSEVYTSPTHNIDFLFTVGPKKEKQYVKNTENVCRVLRHHPQFKDTLRFDNFKNRMQLKVNNVWRNYTDSDDIDIQTSISILFPFLRLVSKDMARDAALKVSKENTIDSARDFIAGIPWDKEARLDTWLTHTYGTPNDEYHQRVGANWMKGLVKRIAEPGCKFDYVLVLEGPQGAKKSTSLNIIGAMPDGYNWHVETTMSTDHKDFFQQFEGKAIIEFSEGETLSRTEVKKMKSIITTAWDRYRPSYGRISEDFPRRCVFAMTTNQDEYLKDETGNRRWLPIRVTLPEVDIDWLTENRDQLLAEAYHRVMNLKETTYEFPKEETRKQQDARRVSDPNEDKIAEWYYSLSPGSQEQGVTAQMVYNAVFGGVGAMKKYEEMQITNVFATTLNLTKRRKMVNGVQQSCWVNETGTSMQVLEEDLAADVFN